MHIPNIQLNLNDHKPNDLHKYLTPTAEELLRQGEHSIEGENELTSDHEAMQEYLQKDITQNESIASPVELKPNTNYTYVESDTNPNDMSNVTTETERARYQKLSKNVTRRGNIQSTIYHIRKVGQNIYDPEERQKYYSRDFLLNGRHINHKVEQELEDFLVEIHTKVEENTTKFYSFPRTKNHKILMNTSSNAIPR